MGRFPRGSQDVGGATFQTRLPRAFTLQDLLDLIPLDEIPRALAWLYAGVERGEIVPDVEDHPIVYQVAGRQARTADAPQPSQTHRARPRGERRAHGDRSG